MTTLMKLENISEETPTEIISVDTGDLLLGRDSENSVVIDEVAISRVHGNIYEVAGYWFFRDLSSTNGSAVNGEKINPNQIRILRSGDIIHLATFPIRYTEIKPKTISPDTGSLLVFHDSGFQSEFNFNSTNSKFSVGGKGADFVLDNCPAGTIALEFEFNSSDLTLKANKISRQINLTINGEPVENLKSFLMDKDELGVNDYKLIVNFIGLNSPAQEKPVQNKFMDWETTKHSPSQQSRFVFTSTEEDPSVTDTVTMKSADLLLGVGQFGLSQKMNAVSKAQMQRNKEIDPEVEQKYAKFGLMVIGASIFVLIMIIKILAF